MHINSDLARDIQELRSHLQAVQLLLTKLDQSVMRQAIAGAASGKLDQWRMDLLLEGAKQAEAEVSETALHLQVYLTTLEHTLPEEVQP